MNYQFVFWIFIATAFLILELGHPGLFLFLSFCAGALCALVAYFFEFLFIEQLLFMVVGTLSALLLLCFFLKRTKQLNSMREPKTNMYVLHGKQALVVKDITPFTMGEIKIGSELWAARSTQHSIIIPIGSLVEVVYIKGCHCLVKQIR